ncbi:MAG: type II toxin-antitoxin system PemK/MazF family toxin [Natronosporangium sp.]
MRRVAPWQMWMVDFDPQVGREQSGLRPAVVVASRTHCDLRTPVTLVVPLTTRQLPLGYRVPVRVPGSRRPSYAITEQITTVSHERLGERPLGRLDPDTISQLRDAIREMIDI